MGATETPKSIAVIGAGVTGLTAAHRLTRHGHRVRVFEASGRVGGVIRSEQINGWLIEAGPNTVLSGEPAVTSLIRELGLESEQFTASAAAKHRFVLRRGRPMPLPTSPGALVTSPLFSPVAKLSVLAELFSPRRVRTTDLSLEDFVRSHFGQEFVDYALNPFVAGVYAGNPQKLSARHAFPRLWELEHANGSLLRAQAAAAKARKATGAAAPAILSFRDGLQRLTDELARRLPAGVLSLHTRVEALIGTPSAAGGTDAPLPWSIVWNNGTTTDTEKFDRVVVALPAPALAQLRFGTLGERPLASLDTIDHPPVSTVFLGYRRGDVAHPLDGFGLLVPEVERRSFLGVLFTSTLFPGRAPEGHVALTVFVGGTRQPELARLPTDRLLRALQPDLRALLGVRGEPVLQRHTFWPRAIPQYNVGYENHLETMAAAERAHPGLLIGGQARDGIALPACIAAGEKLAARAGA